MNTDPYKNLAERLIAEPDFLKICEEQSLRELLLDYSANMLEPDAAAEVKEMIRLNPKAAAIWKQFEEIDAFMQSDAGKKWAGEGIAGPERVLHLPDKTIPSMPSVGFLDRLSAWIVETFSSLRLQGAYADTAAGRRKVFPAAADDPYKPWLVQDQMGRWYLRVVTEDAEAAKVRLRLELEREMPVLEFQPTGDGEFFAEVRLTEAMAEALKSGHRPVFLPVE